jgi:seryl-tRNA synthetase
MEVGSPPRPESEILDTTRLTNLNVAVPDAVEEMVPLPEGRSDLFDSLVGALFRPMGVVGVYARTSLFEEMVDRLSNLISRHREPATEVLRFPPVMSRRHLEQSGYLKDFPNLLGCICALHGTEAEIHTAAGGVDTGDEWTTMLGPTDLVLAPAACFALYPLVAGPVSSDGLRFDVACDCFRREPSPYLDRLQSFRMREYVCIGSARDVANFRECWMARAQQLAVDLGLPFTVAPASDPFFGKTGRVMALSQLQQSLKFELLIPMRSTERPTACMSFNYHRDHFGSIWGLRDEAGKVVHSGCVAFGLDRLVLALFWRHGLDLRKWPAAVQSVLML